MDLEDAGTRVKFALHDRDASFTLAFDAVFRAAGVRVIRSAVRAPRMNSIMERWINPDAAGAMLDCGQDVDLRAVEKIGGEKSSARSIVPAIAGTPASPSRRGAGSIPALLRICHTVDAATVMPSPASSP